uniref:Large ribosomal subunit protein mL64 n=1 Tax=Plectus sambesii TaxID=2011161 RepID=A0A914VHF7_9BILA
MRLNVNFRLAVSVGRIGYPARYATTSASQSGSAQKSDATNEDKLSQQQSDADVVYSSTDTFREDIYLEFNREMLFRGLETADDDIDRQRLKETEEKRNVSRMRPWHQMLVNKQVPPVQFNWQLDRNALKARYAKYGKKSGVNPGLLWPTDKELDEQLALNRDMQPYLPDVVRKHNAEQKAEALRQSKRIAEVEANEKKYAKVLAAFEAEQLKAVKEIDEVEAKRQEKIREIQEYFGYWIDPKDPRFGAMQAQKEAEEKKVAKATQKADILRKKVATVTNT